MQKDSRKRSFFSKSWAREPERRQMAAAYSIIARRLAFKDILILRIVIPKKCSLWWKTTFLLPPYSFSEKRSVQHPLQTVLVSYFFGLTLPAPGRVCTFKFFMMLQSSRSTAKKTVKHVMDQAVLLLICISAETSEQSGKYTEEKAASSKCFHARLMEDCDTENKSERVMVHTKDLYAPYC